MKGLIIKPFWADLILDGEKNIEIRSSNTNIRGKIGIIKSGSKKVFGTVELIGSEELTEEKFNLWKDRHRLDISYAELIEIYPKPYAWHFANAERYNSPVNYNHKQGCVIWVNLSNNN